MNKDLNYAYDFTGFSGIEICLRYIVYNSLFTLYISCLFTLLIFRSQGPNVTQWTLKLKTDISSERRTSYNQNFAPMFNNGKDFQTLHLPFEDFHEDFRGKVPPDEIPLNLAKIKSIGLQGFGGVYDDFKQNGPCTLEIDYIKVV